MITTKLITYFRSCFVMTPGNQFCYYYHIYIYIYIYFNICILGISIFIYINRRNTLVILDSSHAFLI